MAKRDLGHKTDLPGYGVAVLNKFDVGLAFNRAERYQDLAYHQMRGREQQLIDFHGGAWSDTGQPYKTGNKIRGVKKENIYGKGFHAAATIKWGELYKYTGK